MTGARASILFPAEPRSFPGRRAVKIGLRAIHVLFAGILVGSYVFAVDPAVRSPWFVGTVVSGLLILLLDLHETAVFLLQVRGLIVLGKIGVVAALPWFGDRQAWVLGLVLVVSVLSSHAPSRARYFVVLGRGSLQAARSKG